MRTILLLLISFFAQTVFASYVIPDGAVGVTKLGQTAEGGPFAVNLGLSATVGSSALTISLKDNAGNNPSATNPIKISFRNGTLTNGQANVISQTSALSITVPSTSSLGQAGNTNQYVWIYAMNDAGAMDICVSGVSVFFDTNLNSSTQIVGSGSGSSTGTVLYCASSHSGAKPTRIIGRALVNEAVTGTWAAAPTQIDLLPVPTYNATEWVNNGTSTWSATSGYSFTIASSSVTIGAIYSNNGFYCTDSATIASLTTMVMTCNGVPAASGTLTLVSGTGPATIAFSAVTTTGSPVKATTKVSDSFLSRRNGSNVEIWVRLGWTVFTGSTAGSGDFILYFPTAIPPFDINTTYYLTVMGNTGLPNASNEIWVCGTIASNFSSGAVDAVGLVPYQNQGVAGGVPAAVRLIGLTYATGGNYGALNSASNINWTAGSTGWGIDLKCTIPIYGWTAYGP